MREMPRGWGVRVCVRKRGPRGVDAPGRLPQTAFPGRRRTLASQEGRIIGVPGYDRPISQDTHFQAGQRAHLGGRGGVGEPGNESMQGDRTHFQAGQRAHLGELAQADFRGVLVVREEQVGVDHDELLSGQRGGASRRGRRRPQGEQKHLRDAVPAVVKQDLPRVLNHQPAVLHKTREPVGPYPPMRRSAEFPDAVPTRGAA